VRKEGILIDQETEAALGIWELGTLEHEAIRLERGEITTKEFLTELLDQVVYQEYQIVPVEAGDREGAELS
jgi:hypothetical protein